MPQVINIKQMVPASAVSVLDSIFAQIRSSQSVDSQSAQDLIDATHHYDASVVERAFSVIGCLQDKQLLVSVLLKHASNHNNPIMAEYAYKAMSGAKDLSPFYRVIGKGILCPDWEVAAAALHPIGAQALSQKSIDVQLQQPLIDATDHHEDLVVCDALDIIRNITDKQQYVPALLKHASNHSQPECALSAYRAMSGANDFSPFYQVIEQGTLSPERLIAFDAITPIYEQAEANRIIDPQFHQAVMNVMNHADYTVADYGLETIDMLQDKQPFISALQNFSKNPARSPWAQQSLEEAVADLLAYAGIVQSAAPGVATTRIVSIKGVRLDFNIEANGCGPQVHHNSARLTLGARFDKSVANGVVPAKAKVFYDPNSQLQSDAIIDVKFPAEDKDHILHWLDVNIAPKFDLQKGSDGIYAVTLKERPSP